MGTHPIFESDFDCLTDMNRLIILTPFSRRNFKVSVRLSAMDPTKKREYISVSQLKGTQIISKESKSRKVAQSKKIPEESINLQRVFFRVLTTSVSIYILYKFILILLNHFLIRV